MASSEEALIENITKILKMASEELSLLRNVILKN
jgi:hypothetical protein